MEQRQETSLTRQGWNHLKLQRPLAAWACWQRALRINPDDEAPRQALDSFETLEELPAAARAVYRFSHPGDGDRRDRWNARLLGQNLEELEEAAKAFRSLAKDDPLDADAHLNLGLCLAWEGKNVEAMDELDEVVTLLAEAQPDRAADAWTLAEVLRFGGGAETLSDDLRCVWTLEASFLPGADFYETWPNLLETEVPIDPMTGTKALTSGRVFEWLDRPLVDSNRVSLKPRGADIPRKLASVILSKEFLRLSSPDPATFECLQDPLLLDIETALRPARREIIPLPMSWADAALSTFRIPPELDTRSRDELTRELVELYHETLWIRQPRHGLLGKSPIEAARLAVQGNVALRAKLLGIIRFREQLGSRATHEKLYQGYPFDRLRRRLGLIPADANPASFDPDDISCMSEAELDAIEPNSLDDHRLVEAAESSAPFLDDARTAKFAKELLERGGPNLKRIEVNVLVAPLVRLALKHSDPSLAIRWLELASSIHDDPIRRTLIVWSAEVNARAGRPDAALQIYRSLVAANPALAVITARDGAETLIDNGFPSHAKAVLEPSQAPESDLV